MNPGKYRLVRLLGRGGMGEVWEGVLAGEQGFSRRVAIKRMVGAHVEGFERRFMDEARIAARLHHANIVSVLDFGVEDGAYFQVLELVEGVDALELQQRLHSRGLRLPVELALHLCAEVAHGLACAHDARDELGRALNIVHRDVSLENILLSWDGDVKLSDFGVAKARDRVSFTQSGVVGKPSYMAPEQATGGAVDGRTDVFALGCALHALLAGVTPLAGENRLAQLLAGTPLPVDGSIPLDAAQFISRAVSRSKADRFPTAAAAAETLAQLRHSRLSQDPRTALREFLAPLRPARAQPTGALDALLAPAPTLSAAATPGAPSVPIPPGAPRARRASKAPALAAGGALLLLTTFASWFVASSVLWKPADVTVPGAPPIAPPAAPPAAAQLTRPADAEPQPTGAPKSGEPSEPAAKAAPESAPGKAAAKGRAARAEAAPAVAQGVLAIGGTSAQRAEILIDGHSVGFAPKRLEVPLGVHEVVLVTPEGRRIGPHRMEVNARHTDLDPARWLVQD